MRYRPPSTWLPGRLIRSQNHGWYLHDARGSVVQRTNAQGNVLRNYRYTAFGVELGDNASDICPFRFTGEHFDLSSGIITEDADWSFHSTRQQILRPCGTNGDVLILQTPPSGVFSVAQTRVLGLSTNTTYVLEFYYWADYDGELLQADMAANVPAGQQTRVSFSNVESNILSFTANRTVQKARIELESADEVISLAFLRFMCPPTSNGRIFVSNVRLYNKETVETGAFLVLDSATVRMSDVSRHWNSSRQMVNRPETNSRVEAIELTPNGSTAWTPVMELGSHQTFILEFEYWSDTNGVSFHADLYYLATSRVARTFTAFTAGTTVRRARVEISTSGLANGVLSGLRFTNYSGGNIYIRNVVMYNANMVGVPPGGANPWRFNGEYWDAHRGEYYLRARSFNPRTGRFSSSDPYWGLHNMQFGSNPMMRNGRMMPNRHAIAQSGNLFMFVMHDPVNWTDPTGLWAIEVHVTYTIRWARAAGFSRAQAFIIADANIGVDLIGPAAFWQPRKDTSWHLNTYAISDSRLAHSERMLAYAIFQWNMAEANFNVAVDSLSSSNRVARRAGTLVAKAIRDAQRTEALQMLGQGLHALQDISAHGNIAGHRVGSGHDNISFNWVCNITRTDVVHSGQSHGERFYEAQAATMHFFERFLEGIGGSL